MKMVDDSYPDLGFGDDEPEDSYDTGSHDQYREFDYMDYGSKSTKKQLIKTSKTDQSDGARDVIIQNFEAYPAIVHFSEWTITEGCTQVISITNRSRRSLRFQIYPPTSNEFTTHYDKIGNLAPGMSQLISIKFMASEYKYYYDNLRIQGEDSSLLIPLHGYPIANKVHFPKSLLFGAIPLCEPSTQKISLSCSIPVNFSFEIKILQSHPYYTVEPKKGIIPANGNIDINIIFNPVTLGTCKIKIQLHIGMKCKMNLSILPSFFFVTFCGVN